MHMLVTPFEIRLGDKIKRTFAAWTAEMVCTRNFAVKVMNKGEPEDVFELVLYCIIAGIQDREGEEVY